jgi:hypothetical protein
VIPYGLTIKIVFVINQHLPHTVIVTGKGDVPVNLQAHRDIPLLFAWVYKNPVLCISMDFVL